MRPAARIEAAIELLHQIESAEVPADLLARDYFRKRRFIGSKDRRAISDLVYGVLRRRARLDWWLARGGGLAPAARNRVLANLTLVEGRGPDEIADLFDGGRYHPKALIPDEAALLSALPEAGLDHEDQPDWVRGELPDWLHKRLGKSLGEDLASELAALGVEAGLDLRVNTLKGTREEAASALAGEGIETQPTPLSPLGLRVQGRHALPSLAAFRDGLVEVQDEGAQLAALLCDVQPDMAVADFCAGAGGKTLALAAAMANRGRLVALDSDKTRLKRAEPRFERAGVTIAELRGLKDEGDAWLSEQAGAFDRVLVDAPCSGSGTWRRQPDARWRLSVADLNRVFAVQRRILSSAATLVRPGGRLIYVTCGLFAEENEDQVAGLLQRTSEFRLLPVPQIWSSTVGGTCPVETETLLLTPARHGTDGFFVAVLERRGGA